VEMTPEQYQEHASPFDRLVGWELLEASGTRVVGRLDVREQLHQPTGIVHGGVYATVIETTCSLGGWLATDRRRPVVGITNSTDFLRAVRDGVLTFTATAIQQGRTLQLWEVEVRDEDERLVAHGKVKLMNLGD
jgi:1,4-dihydroxy-2-naphthoyl-CoA hydrolase